MENIENKLRKINAHLSKANQEDFLDVKIEMLRVDEKDRYIDVIFGTMGALFHKTTKDKLIFENFTLKRQA